jgi:hypothetical protein
MISFGVTITSVNMCRFAYLLALFFVQIASASAQNSIAPSKKIDLFAEFDKAGPRDGQFRRNSFQGIHGISCTMTLEAGTPPTDYSHCLRIGTLKIGMQISQLQSALSKLATIPEQNILNPRIVDKSSNGSATLLFPISVIPIAEGFLLQSYLVALINHLGTVQVIQLSGKPTDTSEFFPFSSITLGTTKDKLLEIMGNPSSIIPAPQVQGKLWSYEPFPFSFEVVNDVVHSVRVHAPSDGDLRKPFVPLKSLLQQ